MPRQDVKIALCLKNFPLENSPTAKGVASFLHEKGYDVDIVVDRPSALLPPVAACGVRTIRLFPLAVPLRIEKLFRGIFRPAADAVARRAWKRIMGGYGRVIAVEMDSLHFCASAGYPLSQAAYLSLDCDSFVRRYPPGYAADRIGKCRLRVIQNEAKQKDLEQLLGKSFSWRYMPVSCRPRKHVAKHPVRSMADVNCVFSGSFAPWSCLHDFFGAYAGDQPVRFRLHGYSRDTSYLSQLRELLDGRNDVEFDTRFYGDDEHAGMLARHNIALCFYRNESGTLNGRHMLFSSGKIAVSLWAGCAVMTNIDSPLTREPPFLYVPQFDRSSIQAAFEAYAASAACYREAAYAFADTRYNLDRALEPIAAELVS
jgi:hypothetical protein